jgi:formylglycine-generating enzyme required for sulfatase activity
VTCNAAAPPAPTPEVCNGIDDDCDGGTPDEGAPDLWVQFTNSGGTNRWMYQYEASHPDGSAAAQGSMTHRPCSASGRLPWTNVTRPQAEAACVAVGARLCRETDWQRACETSAMTACDWSYDAMCTAYSADKCNGNDHDTNMTLAGDQDDVLPTGSMPMCYARWGAAMTNRIFDLSGNVEEWTRLPASGPASIRGGSNNDSAGGIRCDFDFVVADDTFQFPNVGFRCCRDTMP